VSDRPDAYEEGPEKVRPTLSYHRTMSRVLGSLAELCFRLGLRQLSLDLGSHAYSHSMTYHFKKGRARDA